MSADPALRVLQIARRNTIRFFDEAIEAFTESVDASEDAS